MQAVDPVGKPFMDLFTIELKRGYSKDTFQDLLDKPKKKGYKISKMESFVEQAITSAEQAKTPSWMLVIKRDRRDPIVILPRRSLYHKFCSSVRSYTQPCTMLRFERHGGVVCEVMIVTWNDFREYDPDVFV